MQYKKPTEMNLSAFEVMYRSIFVKVTGNIKLFYRDSLKRRILIFCA